MVISSKSGSILSNPPGDKPVEYVMLEWFETNKRILHKKTDTGRLVILRFLQENPDFKPGNVLFEDDKTMIVIDIALADVIVIRPKDIREVAAVCYEIGNKHLPLFYQDDELLVPFDQPLYNFLKAAGYAVGVGKKKLITPLRTSVTPHNNTGGSLFARIMKLTTDQG